jgi:hypothetical protein
MRPYRAVCSRFPAFVLQRSECSNGAKIGTMVSTANIRLRHQEYR